MEPEPDAVPRGRRVDRAGRLRAGWCASAGHPVARLHDASRLGLLPGRKARPHRLSRGRPVQLGAIDVPSARDPAGQGDHWRGGQGCDEQPC